MLEWPDVEVESGTIVGNFLQVMVNGIECKIYMSILRNSTISRNSLIVIEI